MKFYHTGTEYPESADLVCRNIRWNLVILLGVFWAIPVGWWILGAPVWLAFLTGGLALLLTVPLFNTWIRRGRRDNWTVAVTPDGIWLNLRDVEYHRAAAADTIARIPFREIRSMRKSVHRYTTPDSEGGSVKHRDLYLELQLEPSVAVELADAISAEQKRQPASSQFLGISVRTKRNDAPLRIRGDALHVKFRTSRYCLSPGLPRVLSVLATRIASDIPVEDKSKDWEQMSESELHDFVEELVSNGDTISACKLLVEKTGVSLTEAHQLVEQR